MEKENYLEEFKIAEGKDLFEAFNAFIMINPSFPSLARENYSIAKPHYVKQDLGLDFIYDCNFYGIKMIKMNKDFINYPYLDCTITKFYYHNNVKIVESSISFIYDCMKSNIINDVKTTINPEKIIRKHLS